MIAMEKPRTILVVDTSEQIRVLLTAFLTRCGFAVESAESVENAIGKLRCCPFDVVVMDPGTDGVARLASLFPDIVPRTIVIAAPPHGPVTERVQAVLEKPFDLGNLLEAATSCARVRHLHQA